MLVRLDRATRQFRNLMAWLEVSGETVGEASQIITDFDIGENLQVPAKVG